MPLAMKYKRKLALLTIQLVIKRLLLTRWHKEKMQKNEAKQVRSGGEKDHSQIQVYHEKVKQ